jgi:phage shock protein A
VTGAGEEMEDISRTIERAEEQTEEMEARAAALDELRESGAIENAVSDKSQLDRELQELSTDSAVDRELDTLKSEMGKGESESDGETETESETETQSAVTPAEPAEDVDMEEVETEVSEEEIDQELEELKEEE